MRSSRDKVKAKDNTTRLPGCLSLDLAPSQIIELRSINPLYVIWTLMRLPSLLATSEDVINFWHFLQLPCSETCG
jgi:hypothetical protein